MRIKTRIPISTLLTGSVGILVFVTVSLVLFFSALANVRNTVDLLQTVAEQAMDSLSDDIRAHLDPAEALVEQLRVRVEQGRIGVSDNEAIARFASGAMAAAPQIAGLLVWDKEFKEIEVLRGGNRGINLKVGSVDEPKRARAVARKLFAAGKPQWGAPIHDDGVTYVNILAPLTRKRRVYRHGGKRGHHLRAFSVFGERIQPLQRDGVHSV